MVVEKPLTVRTASLLDKTKIFNLYQVVSALEGGIARTQTEITEDWVMNCLLKSLDNGIMLVVPHPEKPEELIAEIHTYSSGLKAFSHVFGDLTVVVHPGFQGSGVGRLVFEKLLAEVRQHPEVLRVELIVRESNKRAIAFYEKIGFVQEGRLERRIHGVSGELEADIPMAWFNPEFR